MVLYPVCLMNPERGASRELARHSEIFFFFLCLEGILRSTAAPYYSLTARGKGAPQPRARSGDLAWEPVGDPRARPCPAAGRGVLISYCLVAKILVPWSAVR